MVSLSGRFWTKVNRRLDDPLAHINIMDEDAPVETWHMNAER